MFDLQKALHFAEQSNLAYTKFNCKQGNVEFSVNTVNGVQELVFAGTDDFADTEEDLETYTVHRDGIGRICKGDAEDWDRARADILAKLDKAFPVQCSGHSKGGSLAVIAAAELKLRGYNVLPWYTYGAKRTGGHDFAARCKELGLDGYRFVNMHDPVPRLAFWLPHVGQAAYIGQDLKMPLSEIDYNPLHWVCNPFMHKLEQGYIPVLRFMVLSALDVSH